MFGAIKRTHHVIVIPGDGVGPEIAEEALEVLKAVETRRGDFKLELVRHDAGAEQYLRTGHNLLPETLQACRNAGAVLKGPVGLPSVRLADGTEAGLLGGVLRNGLDPYANVRPIKLWPGVRAPVTFKPGQIDYVIVRENTEGLNASPGRGLANNWAASDVLFTTRPGVTQSCHFAFELVRKRKGSRPGRAHRVTCVDKSNVLRSFKYFNLE